jgi:sulfatase modifying factor 1
MSTRGTDIPAARMVAIEGGSFRMGAAAFSVEEGPVSEVAVGPFEIDATAVTNAEFAAFVAATGYVTMAERTLDPQLFPGVDPAPGSLVFTPTAGPVDLRDWRQWWRWQPGADWQHPFGPGSGIEDKADHPVVQVTFEDAGARMRGQAAPHRGRVGVRGARRPRRRRIHVGRRAAPAG